MPLDLSCPDWIDRLQQGRSLIPDDARGINPREAQRATDIFDMLVLPDVPGMPPLAEAAGEWFREIVGVMLGAFDPKTGERLIRELFLLAAKKNSKTSYGAAMMLTALLMNKRPRAEFLLIAPTREIAELAFTQAQGMVENDPHGFLQRRMHVQDHLKQITDRRTRAHLKIKSFDPSVLTGVKPAGVLIDELHEIAKNAKAGKIIGQIRGGLLPIPEAFLAIITTQADEPPAGAFKAELALARAIRDGRATAPTMPILYEFPEALQRDQAKPPAWMDERNWPMVLPNLGRSITIARLVEDFEQAKQKGEEEIRRWASQHLNIEVGMALHSNRWEGADYWERAADRTLDLEELIRRCEVVAVGVDGGGLDDLLALTALGRERETRHWLAWNFTWAHVGVLELRKEIAPRLLDFKAAGELEIVAQMPDAFADLADIVSTIKESGVLFQVGLDPAGVGLIVDALAERDIQGKAPHGEEWVIGVSQGWRLMGAIKTTAVKLASGELRHAGQSITAWSVDNAKVEPKGNAITITKQTAGSAKIDPLMSLFDAVAIMSTNPQTKAPPSYQLIFA